MSDYIERVAAMAAIRDLYPGRPWLKRNFEWWGQKNKAYIECERAVQSLPAADVAPVRHGRWERVDYGNGLYNYHCSSCRHIPRGNIRSNYCPNCGAKMDGGET